jgi:hypothetical protein
MKAVLLCALLWTQPLAKVSELKISTVTSKPKLIAAVSQSTCGTSSRLFDWHVPDEIRENIEHSPGLRTPSKHVVGVQSVTLEKTFVQDPPEGSEAEQSPTVSALGSNSDASQFAKRSNVGKCINVSARE